MATPNELQIMTLFSSRLLDTAIQSHSLQSGIFTKTAAYNLRFTGSGRYKSLHICHSSTGRPLPPPGPAPTALSPVGLTSGVTVVGRRTRGGGADACLLLLCSARHGGAGGSSLLGRVYTLSKVKNAIQGTSVSKCAYTMHTTAIITLNKREMPSVHKMGGGGGDDKSNQIFFNIYHAMNFPGDSCST